MCGIAGCNWEDKKLIMRMADMLEHRGPDGFGYFTDDYVSLAHRRLAILDLSEKGKQPMSDASGRYWITYNGEVYNFAEIRAELETHGHRFASGTDTEVLIYAYMEWGQDMLSKLNGMFAFCIYDTKEKAYFLARDRMGIKPLYYHHEADRFVFASELKSILEAVPTKIINKQAIKDYLTFGFIQSPGSILQEVKTLRPGHLLMYKNGQLTIQKYWSLDYSKKLEKSEDYFEKKIMQHLEQSVERRLVADVPVGSFLSGGIDSSAISTLLAKRKDNLNTFSVSFDHEEFNESAYAQRVAEEIGSNHHEVQFSGEQVTKLIPKLAFLYDEPFADPSMIPTYLVSKVAKEHVTVSLSGDGGDESFAGYSRYAWFKMMSWHKHTPGAISSGILYPAVTAAHRITGSHAFKKGKIFFEDDQNKDHEIYAKILAYSTKRHRDKLSLLQNKNPYTSFDAPFKEAQGGDRLLNCDVQRYLPDNILVKLDRASMGVGLEGRVPFLDHEFMEFSAKIPFRYKLKGLQTKNILKKALKNTLPKEIIYRKKQGFGVPLKHYFKDELKDYLSQRLLDKDAKYAEYVNQETVQKLYDHHQSGREDNNYILFSLLMLEEWFQRWAK
ncbi:asparagine synthase (glutamine-hydrolyzing) [Candidatus Woesearchaeota archaeon]|nr:asparagine synthase (glutamine-hydrolyzing) [Candidatus Woesearchaeota archaeon]